MHETGRCLAAFAVALIGALLLTACGGGGGNAAPARTPAQMTEDDGEEQQPARTPARMTEDDGEEQQPARTPARMTEDDGGGRNAAPTAQFSAEALKAGRENLRVTYVKAARNTPNPGSVTQSSTGDGATADSVSVSVERAADRISPRLREAGGWSVDRDSAGVPLEGTNFRTGWSNIELHQTPGGGKGDDTGPGLYVDLYTDIKKPTTEATMPGCGRGGTVSEGNPCSYVVGGQTFTLRIDGTSVCLGSLCAGGNINSVRSNINGVTFTLVTEGSGTSRTIAQLSENFQEAAGGGGSTETRQDTDYLAGGIWHRIPADAASVADYEVGAFMDGNDPFRQANLAGLTGTATYAGERGVFAYHSHQESDAFYIVNGDVRLTADFGDASGLGSIGGTVSNFRGLESGPDYEGVSVVLGTAQIGSANSGFFTGATSTAGTDSAFTGKWGGQFYGNGEAGAPPGSVAGTFGAATADGSESFIGIYGAYRQQ